MRIRIKRLSPEAELPHYAHGHLEDAGLDLRSTEAVTLPPFEARLVPTGLSIELPPGYEALLQSYYRRLASEQVSTGDEKLPTTAPSR